MVFVRGRYLMGSVLMASSCLAVYFGPGYAFWLVPALVFWYYLLPGTLPTNTQVRDWCNSPLSSPSILRCSAVQHLSSMYHDP